MFSWTKEHILNAWRDIMSSEKVDQCSTDPSTETENATSKWKKLSINIMSSEGNVESFDVATDTTVSEIKSTAIKRFYGDAASNDPANFNLIQSSEYKLLEDDCDVTDQNIADNDELVLIKLCAPPETENLTDEDLKGPSEETILRVSKDLPTCTPREPPNIPLYPHPEDFRNLVRKVLITLVKASARILVYSPEAPQICDVLKDRLEARCKPIINPSTVKNFMEKGFSEQKVLLALRLHRSDTALALKWLMDHRNDPLDDLDLVSFEKESETSGEEENLIDIVDRLLESYHRYRRIDFTPDATAMQQLLEMGFEEKNIIEALKITGNSRTYACEWLLGERRPGLQDVDAELDSDSQIYNAIMTLASIQLSLTSPHILLVALATLESLMPVGAPVRDIKMRQMMDDIVATCNSEKKAIRVNRFNVQ